MKGRIKLWQEQLRERSGSPRTDAGMAMLLSEVLTGGNIMLEGQDDGLEVIIFNRITLACYDRGIQSVVRID